MAVFHVLLNLSRESPVTLSRGKRLINYYMAKKRTFTCGTSTGNSERARCSGSQSECRFASSSPTQRFSMKLNNLFNTVNNKEPGRVQQSVLWLKRGQPCLHHLHVLSSAFSWRTLSSSTLWIILLPSASRFFAVLTSRFFHRCLRLRLVFVQSLFPRNLGRQYWRDVRPCVWPCFAWVFRLQLHGSKVCQHLGGCGFAFTCLAVKRSSGPQA